MSKNYRVIDALASSQFPFVVVDQAGCIHGYCSDRAIAERHAARWQREGR
jgi:hypothetical protein